MTNKTKDTVWVSRCMSNTRLIKGFNSELSSDDMSLEDRLLALDTMMKSSAGIPLPADLFPKIMTGSRPDKSFKKMPHIFMANGFWVVSREVVDVLRQFDLGQTNLYPTQLFQYNGKTPIVGEHFCVSFGETKDVFLPELSPEAAPPYGHDPIIYWRWSGYEDFGITVDQSALEGVDLWIDPKLKDAFFLSGRLAEALIDAKLKRYFSMKKCGFGDSYRN